MAYRSFNFTSFKLEVSEKLPQGLTLLIYYQSLVMFLNIAKLDNTEESVECKYCNFLAERGSQLIRKMN